MKPSTKFLDIKSKVLGIVGGGPRGLAALESAYGWLIENDEPKKLSTILFETEEHFGAGQVYDLSQPDTNWLNLSERALTLAGRNAFECTELKIPSFPSFHDWSGYNTEKENEANIDEFPLRSTLGKYLNERYESIASVLIENELLQVIKAKVIETDWDSNTFKITTEDKTIYKTDELVLTIGHQPTILSDQLKSWSDFSTGNPSIDLITEPYSH